MMQMQSRQQFAAIHPPPGLEEFNLACGPMAQALQLQSQLQNARLQPTAEASAEVTGLLLALMQNMGCLSPADSPVPCSNTTAMAAPHIAKGASDHGDHMSKCDTFAAWGCGERDWNVRRLATVDKRCSLGAGAMPRIGFVSNGSDAASWDTAAPGSDSSEPDRQGSDADRQGATLMVRNLPHGVTQDMLLKHWPVDGTWDMMYLPWNTRDRCNYGYAFINFVSEWHAAAFKSMWHGTFLDELHAELPVSVSMAGVQGFEANVMQLKKKRVDRIRIRSCQPIILRNGLHVDLKDV
mmetsp:Transcript_120455/g.236760  ORF Transcript_120455/g.236760 Transcript_120455/m.236760 type:complete len:295 (+) Transcript_120455:105-989(+)